MPEKILLVDDDLDTLRLVGLMLQRQGYDIRAASNGLQALAMAQNEPVDLILLDVMMPEMDGYEVARRLRADAATADIPIIMFTAKAEIDDKVMGFDAGADDYLTKPTQPRELFAHMKAVLARASKSRTTAAPTSERGYVIGVLSCRGGVGVSTLAVNLGVSLAEESKKATIVADFRPGQGTIGLELGYLKAEGLNRLLQRKPTEISSDHVQDEIFTHQSGIRLLLASAQPRDARNISAVGAFDTITRHLAHLGRYIILDLGPGLPPVTEKVISHCDEVIVIVEPLPPSINQTKLLLSDLASCGVGAGRTNLVLLNRVRSGVQLSWSQVQEQLGANVSAVLTPAPELAYQAATNNVPMIVQQPDSLTAQQILKLTEKIMQRSRPGS